MNFMTFHFIIPNCELLFFRGVGIPPARYSSGETTIHIVVSKSVRTHKNSKNQESAKETGVMAHVQML